MEEVPPAAAVAVAEPPKAKARGALTVSAAFWGGFGAFSGKVVRSLGGSCSILVRAPFYIAGIQ